MLLDVVLWAVDKPTPVFFSFSRVCVRARIQTALRTPRARENEHVVCVSVWGGSVFESDRIDGAHRQISTVVWWQKQVKASDLPGPGTHRSQQVPTWNSEGEWNGSSVFSPSVCLYHPSVPLRTLRAKSICISQYEESWRYPYGSISPEGRA